MACLKRFYSCLWICLGFVFVLPVSGDDSTRLVDGWEYAKGDLGGPWEAWRKAKHSIIWESVALPHCFNASDSVDPDVQYYQGPGWYRTKLKVRNNYKKGRTLLHFEGAGQKTKVFVGLEQLGDEHVGGYDEFWVDLTGHGKEPAVTVRCDNSRDLRMIPSDLSDFNVYGGLYRYVNLVYVPQVSIERLHIKSNLNDQRDKATIELVGRLYNPDRVTGALEYKVKITGPDGYSYQESFKRKIGERAFALPPIAINKPALWSCDNPQLYRVTVSLVNGNGDVHKVTERFGLRSFEFVKHGPFKLNGERLLLRGTHRHEDHAGVAAAMTEEMIRKEMHLIKDLGINFLRLGHYQQSRIVLDLCDELGFVVWEEIPWCRAGVGGEQFKEWARGMMRNLIDQHYNHPSVIIWGLGNEHDWYNEGPNFVKKNFDGDAVREFMTELHELSHALDPTRKTAVRRAKMATDIPDIYSPSIWAGWYQGRYTDYMKTSHKNMLAVDHFLHVEWGGSHHARRHSEDPDQGLENIEGGDGDEREGDYLMTGGKPRVSKDSTWSVSYAVNLMDWHLKEQEKMPWLTGTAQWLFKDFSTPLRPDNPVPYVNQKGIVQRDLTPKETYYVFQSYWTDKPMAHIYGHNWPVRWGAVGEKRMVKVYSNCSEATLYLNGKSMGTRKRDSQNFPAAGLRWAIAFKKGKNHLKVIARKDGAVVEDEIDFLYQTEKWGKSAKLVLKEIARDNDVITIKVTSLDKNGVMCLTDDQHVEFDIAGLGELIDNLGTITGSRKVGLQNGVAQISLRLNKGSSVVSVSSKKLSPVFLNVSDR